ncbi:MAG TPA: sigma-70 family RNA polymerase sigma factor [Accumulibacter sp.]|nr:sigma-70 family RNA polymerase sigma factor [Accumulibacter sp.]
MKTRAEQLAEDLKTWKPDAVTEHKMTSAEKMRRVLELRYLEGMTLEEVGSLMGVTRERVRQIEAKAIRILRAKSENRTKALDALAGIRDSGQRS